MSENPVLHPFAVRVRVGFEHVYFIAAEDAAAAVSAVESFPGLHRKVDELVADTTEFTSFETVQGEEAVRQSPAFTAEDFVRVYDRMFPDEEMAR